MTDEIRRAMEARMSALEGSPERRARIRARIEATEREEAPPMKRKWSAGMIVAVALLVALGSIAAAEMAGLNLFAYFAQSDRPESYYWNLNQRKLDSLREKNTLISVSASHLEELQEKYYEIHDAYYDGDVLFLGTICWPGFAQTAAWTPTEDECEAIRAQPEYKHLLVYRTEPKYAQEEGIIASFNRAVSHHQPAGFKRYYYAGFFNHFQTTEGTRLWPTGFGYSEQIGDDSVYYSAFQMQSPLPEEIRQKETIEIQHAVPVNVEYNWYDGEDFYTWTEEHPDGMLTATIGRDPEARQRRYGSETIMLDGVPVFVEATASAYLTHVTLRAEEPIFLPQVNQYGIEVNPWDICLFDEAGEQLVSLVGYVAAHYAYDQKFTLYERESEDGMTCERYLSLTGDIPRTLTVSVSQDGAEPVSVVLNPVD